MTSLAPTFHVRKTKLLQVMTHSDSHCSLSCCTGAIRQVLIICAQKPGGKSENGIKREQVPAHTSMNCCFGYMCDHGTSTYSLALLCTILQTSYDTRTSPRATVIWELTEENQTSPPLTPTALLQPSRRSSYICRLDSEIWFTTKFPRAKTHTFKGENHSTWANSLFHCH